MYKSIDILQPKYMMKNFTKHIFFKSTSDKLFIKMLKNGRKKQTYLQRIFAAEYFDYLLHKKLKYLSKNQKQCLNNIIKIVNKYKINDKKYLQKTVNLQKIAQRNIIKIFKNMHKDIDKCTTLTENDKNLKAIFKSISDTFFNVEIGLPQYHYYTGLMGFSYDFGVKHNIKARINNIYLLHIIDNHDSQIKTNNRAHLFYDLMEKCIISKGADLSKYDIDTLIMQNTSDISNSPLFSTSTPMSISFPRADGSYHNDKYILTEGNGRLAALKSACDRLKRKYHDFQPPLMKIKNSQIKSKIGVQNQYYLLVLLWSILFPKFELSGYKNQTNYGIYKPTKKNLKLLKKYPFMYGYIR
jgi:hypothetical protein